MGKYRLEIIVAACIGMITVIFYASPMRERCEEYFFDLRTQLKSIGASPLKVVIIEIDDVSVRALEPKGAQNLSWQSMVQVLKALENIPVAAIGFLMFENIFNFSHPNFPEFIATVLNDQRVFLGVLAYTTAEPDVMELPSNLLPLQHRLRSANTFRERSNSIVRKMPVASFLGERQQPSLGLSLAQMAGRNAFDVVRDAKKSQGFVWLNFMDVEAMERISLKDFLTNPTKFESTLSDKVVLLGHNAFYPWVAQTRDQIYANTPLKTDVASFSKGMPLLYITANFVENLMAKNYLVPAHVWYNVAQTVFTTAALVFFWMVGSIFATISTAILWLILLAGHAILFSYFSFYIPLTETFLFNSLATFVGGIFFVQRDLKILAVSENEAEKENSLMQIQGQVLSQFSETLLIELERIKSYLEGLSDFIARRPQLKILWDKSLATCAEFGEYLTSIRQVSNLDRKWAQDAKVKSRNIDLFQFLQNLCTRFYTITIERNIQVCLDDSLRRQMMVPAEYLDAILHNFVSNAFKYSPDHSQVKISCYNDRSNLIIEVADEGPGIPDSDREKIFERFYRVKDANVYKVKGTGLGLYLARYFAAKMSAQIGYRPNEPKGSVFFLKTKIR